MNAAYASGTGWSCRWVPGLVSVPSGGSSAVASVSVWSLTRSLYVGASGRCDVPARPRGTKRTHRPDRLCAMSGVGGLGQWHAACSGGARRSSGPAAIARAGTAASCSRCVVTVALLARRGGDGAGPRSRPVRPSALVVGVLLAALPVGPLIACFLWLDRYEPEPVRLLGARVRLGRARRHRGRAGPADRRPGGARHDADGWSAVVVAPVTEEAAKGLFVLLLLWCAPARHRRRPRRPRLRRARRRRLRVHREHPLPRRGLHGRRRRRPRRHRLGDRRLRRPRHLQPVRAPAVHRLHRHRRRLTPCSARSAGCAVARAARRATSLAVLAHAAWNGSAFLDGGGSSC